MSKELFHPTLQNIALALTLFLFFGSIGIAQDERASGQTQASQIRPTQQAERAGWIKSKCKIDGRMTTGFVPESHGVADRNQCLYFQAFMIVSTMFNDSGPVLRSEIGDIIDGTSGHEIRCAYRTKKGKVIPPSIQKLLKQPPKDLHSMPLREEFLNLVDFECATS